MSKEKENVEYTLLSNGLDFIVSALNYLNGSPSKRDLKYAVLHLCSGIELVLKERLQWEHWSLIFNDPSKANKTDYKAGDFTSVSFKDCIERLVNICGLNITDRQKIKLLRFRDKRNRFEHFGIVESVEAITASDAEAMNFLIDFIISELHPEDLDEGDAETLAAIRQKLSDFSKFVFKRMRIIKKDLDKVSTVIVACPSCFQDALLLYILA